MRSTYLNIILALAIAIIITVEFCQAQEDYTISGDSQIIKQKETNVTITKAVEGTTLKYDIKTPKVDDFEFVLALDSSGSFGLGGDEFETEKNAIVTAVPRFLKYTKNNYTDKKFNFRVAIVSWNQGVDFAYGGDLNNKNPTNASLVPIDKAVNDIDNLLINHYKPTEDKQTDFSTAVKASLDIFDNHPAKQYNRTLRFIILVTGASEFTRCNDDLINRLKNGKSQNGKSPKLYAVGIKVPDSPPSMMYQHLKELTEGNPDQMQIVKVANSGFVKQGLDDLLYNALKDSLDKATSSAVADNVKFVESLYSYLNPKSVRVNGEDINFNKITNSDGTKTIVFEVPKGLPADAITEVTVDSDLDISNLPVSITKDRRPVTLCTPTSDTQPSGIWYDWLQVTPTTYVATSENQMNIKSRSSGIVQNQGGVQTISSLHPTALLLRLMDIIGLSKLNGMVIAGW